MIRLAVIFLILNLLFSGLVWTDYPYLPLLAVEVLFLSAVFSCLGQSAARKGLAYFTGGIYALLAACASADALIRQSLGRPLNLYLDIELASAIVDQLTSNLGLVLACVMFAGVAILLGGLAFLVGKLLLGFGPHRRLALPGLTGFVGSVVVLGLIIFFMPSSLPKKIAGAPLVGFATKQVERAAGTLEATRAFEQRMATIEDGYSVEARALDRFSTADVVLGFIESYGITTLADERYRPQISKRLDIMQQALDAADLHVVTGRLRSPVQGGQSWLAHATLLSGLWIDSQLHYETLLASDHPTLIDDFIATGHDAVAVMPGITMAWPEGRQFGYTRIHDADTMDYEGPPLNWVTMPDQYTWSWFQNNVRAPATKPVFAELALISSHAPWVPILPVIEDWGSIGTGDVFNQWKDTGETPVSLWRDTERVRDHYVRAIDYALNVTTQYAIRHVDDNTLLIVLGDHQPAPLVTGEGAGRDVPVHIISGNPALLQPFVGKAGLAGFRRGTLPAMSSGGVGMDDLRPFLHQHFSSPLSLSAVN
ncbi:MAG: hypothetical protein WD623_08345 [Marinobacter sp.]|uniref:hypothetical protein n=1 Tax=Marinobacter sp. TaxID=50741 RepID=UPI0034A03F8E